MGNRNSKGRTRGKTRAEKVLNDPEIRARLLDKIQVDRQLVARMANHLNVGDQNYLKNDYHEGDKKVDCLLTCVCRGGEGAYEDLCGSLDELLQHGALTILHDGEKKHSIAATSGPMGDVRSTHLPETHTPVQSPPGLHPPAADSPKARSYKDEIKERLVESYQKRNQIHQVLKGVEGYQQFTNDLTRNFTILRLERDGHNRFSQEEVTLQEALQGSDRNILFLGPPGIGKSSIVLQIILLWAKQQESTLQKIELMIYLEPQYCDDSLERSVQNAFEVRCGPQFAQEALRLFKSREHAIGLVFESLDEVYHLKNLISEIKEEMRNRTLVVIGAVRSLHPAAEKLRDVPSLKRISVLGFTQPNIEVFIDKYFGEEHPQAKEFKRAIASNERLADILKNPLMLVILSILLFNESITVRALAGITKFSVFEHLERFISRRDHISDVILEQFHRFALSFLLDDETTIYQSDLASLGENLPFIELTPNYNMLKAEKGPVATWAHRAFCEYAASKCIAESEEDVRELILALVASRRDLSYILTFAMDLLAFSPEEYSTLINALLTMQSIDDTGEEMQVSGCEHCLNNRQTLKTLHVMEASDLWADGKAALRQLSYKEIAPCRKCLKIEGFWASLAAEGIISNSFDVLNVIRPEERTKVFKDTIMRLLPCSCTRDDNFIVLLTPVPEKARIVKIKDSVEEKNNVGGTRYIYASSYLDMVEFLQAPQHWEHQQPLDELSLDIDTAKLQSNIYGTEMPHPDYATISKLLFTLLLSPACLVGAGVLRFYQHSSVSWTPLIQQIPSHINKLYDWGVRRLQLQHGLCAINEVSIMIRQIQDLGWKMKYFIDDNGYRLSWMENGSKEMIVRLVKTRIEHGVDDELRKEVESYGILQDPLWIRT